MSDRRRNRYTKGYREIAHEFLIMPTHSLPMPKPTKRFERQVRRVRYLSAWLFVKGRPDSECHILDVSTHGAKITVRAPSQIPARFELAILQNDEKRRVCEVAWRRGKMLGVKFVS